MPINRDAGRGAARLAGTLRLTGILIHNSLRDRSLLWQLGIVAVLALAATRAGQPLERLHELLSGCAYFQTAEVDYRRLFSWLMVPTVFTLQNSAALNDALEIQLLSIPRQGDMLRFGIALWLRSLAAAVVWCLAVALLMSGAGIVPHIARGGAWGEVAASLEQFHVWPMLLGYAAGMCVTGSVQTAAHLVSGSARASCVAALGVLLAPLCLSAGAVSFVFPGNMMMLMRYEFVCGMGSVSVGSACTAALGWLAVSAAAIALHARISHVHIYGD